MRQYEVTVTGKSPLILHRDNIEWAGLLKRWREIPENKKLSVPGDDRTPAFSWLGCLYHDKKSIGLDSGNLMRCMMEGGASVVVPGGKSGKTFKAQTQSGMLISEPFIPLIVDGKHVDLAPALALQNDLDFEKHEQMAVDNGYSLFVKRAKIGTTKHVRVRPLFERWMLSFNMNVWDDQITKRVLTDVLRASGDYKGLGDWRPSSRTPGPYGRFDAAIKEI